MITHYTIKESSRSKYPSLRITAHEGLVVVIPPRYKKERIPHLLTKKKSWIQQNLKEWQALKSPFTQNEAEEPQQINLECLGTSWHIHYQSEGAALKEESNTLTINTLCWKKTLEKWLSGKAKEVLAPMLEDLSKSTGLSYSGLSIRQQKSRWGSCSSQKRIQLNLKLLFLPKHLVESVIIHELCHTIHMNHSADFWALVSQHDPDYKKHNQELKNALMYIPAWLERTGSEEMQSIDL